MSEPEITTMSEKGQVVIPRSIREKLKLKPKTKFLVYSYGDAVIMKRLELPDVESELEELWREIDRRLTGKPKPTEREILEEIQRYRRGKGSK